MILILALFLLFNFASLLCAGQKTSPIQCKDEFGQTVDWFLVFKFPMSKDPNKTNTGLTYVYITSKSTNNWTYSNNNLEHKNSLFYQTLEPLFKPEIAKNLTIKAYNDDWPGKRAKEEPEFLAEKAHAKGVVVKDSSSVGFWLIHSIPKFVDYRSGRFYYPSNATKYGQSAMCISLNKADEFGKVDGYLQRISPAYYSLQTNEKDKPKTGDGKDKFVFVLKSSAGTPFYSFSKGPEFGSDLYSDLLAQETKTDWYVETWRQGFGTPLKSACDKQYKVENVEKIQPKFVKSPSSSEEFTYTMDHSKWALSKDPNKPYFCVGDINRMESQFKRGGGTTCISSNMVWNSVKEWITGFETCGRLISSTAKTTKPLSTSKPRTTRRFLQNQN